MKTFFKQLFVKPSKQEKPVVSMELIEGIAHSIMSTKFGVKDGKESFNGNNLKTYTPEIQEVFDRTCLQLFTNLTRAKRI